MRSTVHTFFSALQLSSSSLLSAMSQSYKRPVNSPSFSSSLLDKVFRSIDESDHPTTTGHTSRSVSSERLPNKPKKIATNRRKFDAETTSGKLERNRDVPVSTSSNQYSDRKFKPNVGVMNLKPIRTRTEQDRFDNHHPMKMNREGCTSTSRISLKPRDETPTLSTYQKAKIRAEKMYGNLKDVKQPISPGGRLTRFITSLFTKRNSNHKAEKLREVETTRTRHVPAVSTCSSASSYYRSCLRSKPTDSSKNSVRFCPVNIVIDEDIRVNSSLAASGKKCELDGAAAEEIRNSKQRVVESNLNDLLNKYDKNGVLSVYEGKLSDEEEEDGDGGSCASSDLFELDHIGGNVSRLNNDELPVYETTEFHSKNPASCFNLRRI